MVKYPTNKISMKHMRFLTGLSNVSTYGKAVNDSFQYINVLLV